MKPSDEEIIKALKDVLRKRADWRCENSQAHPMKRPGTLGPQKGRVAAVRFERGDICDDTWIGVCADCAFDEVRRGNAIHVIWLVNDGETADVAAAIELARRKHSRTVLARDGVQRSKYGQPKKRRTKR